MDGSDRPYHHGNLRPALLDAAVALAREGGPGAVILREVSRRAGVSHNAAYRHFADRDELLKVVADRCMGELARRMEAHIDRVEVAGDELEAARGRLRATGEAYVEFALAEPGWFRTAFAVPPGLDHSSVGEGVADGGLGPFALLGAQLDALSAAGGLPAERRPDSEIAAWSGVHGLSTLLLDGPLRGSTEEARAAGLARVLDTIERGL